MKPKYQALCTCVNSKTGERKPATQYVYVDGRTMLVCSSHPLPTDCITPLERSKRARLKAEEQAKLAKMRKGNA